MSEPDPLLDVFVQEVSDALGRERPVQPFSGVPRKIFGRALGHAVADDKARQHQERRGKAPLGIQGYGGGEPPRPGVVLPPKRRTR